MSSPGRHYCYECRSWYRSWPTHASSLKHRNALRAKANPHLKGGGKSGKRALGAKLRSHGRTGEDASMVKVDDYYRNPPTPPWAASIKDRVWYVRDYWRRPPYRATIVHHARRVKGKAAAARRKARAAARARGWL